MDELKQAVQALIRGYDNEKSMYDDDMIGHAETICGQYVNLLPNLIEAFETLEDVVEWLETGKVDGVGFDEQQVLDVAKKVIQGG